MRVQRLFAVAVAAVAFGVSGLAFAQATRTPAEAASYRDQQFRRVGSTFKAINDGLRGSSPDIAAIRANAQILARLAHDLPTWFPPGSGSESGATTRTKVEIWSDAAGFAEQVRLFRTSAQALAGAEELNALRGQFRGVGARCASCHRTFREPE